MAVLDSKSHLAKQISQARVITLTNLIFDVTQKKMKPRVLSYANRILAAHNFEAGGVGATA